MNNHLIEKVIKTNNDPCPDFVFTKPLLDRNVAKALSKSFVEMFTTSQTTSNVHTNLRHTVLNNVRKICKIEPANHISLREDITAVLSECYIENAKETSENSESLDKQLDDFLLRRLNGFNFGSKIKSIDNPEIVQSLINLNPSHMNFFSKNILCWGINNKSINILRSLWSTEFNKEDMYDDLSIKLKPDIEAGLLRIIHLIFTDKKMCATKLFDNDAFLQQLVNKCSISHNCFQLCSGILNYVLIETNFTLRIQSFVALFVSNVKECCFKTNFSLLYPTHLSHIVLLLDFDVSKLSGTEKSKYVDMVLNYIHNLSENDLIMLLSHFPQWFEVYLSQKNYKSNFSTH